MSQYQEYHMENAADDHDMGVVDDEIYFQGRVMGDSDTDDDDDYAHLDDKKTDISAADARRGKDIQGIPWERLRITREQYRKTRLEQYKNYENVPQSGECSQKGCKPTKRDGNYYKFWRNTKSVKSTILHFQKHPGSLLEGFAQTQVSTLAVRDKFLIAGGFQGELICKHLDRPGVSFCSRTTYDDNAITNAVEIYDRPSGAVHFMVSNNDCGVRDFDMERFTLCKHFNYPWPVNHTSMSPDGKLLVIVGDDPDGMLVDSQTGKVVMPLVGHLDFSFASSWHPDGRIFATGNQDKTCRVWDVRNLSKSLAVLKGNIGAISPDTESLFIGVWDRTYDRDSDPIGINVLKKGVNMFLALWFNFYLLVVLQGLNNVSVIGERRMVVL
ncbi:hypothetical protein CRG98_009455 [Punica granatum]|uniref:Uncharacterized protein n=1 Tax=Punica granatum TaxID=22663 RepID=A0A2I0KPA7_PUNGR|nr:hypothetical protein CRG98_009455 [Punica granatum]